MISGAMSSRTKLPSTWFRMSLTTSASLFSGSSRSSGGKSTTTISVTTELRNAIHRTSSSRAGNGAPDCSERAEVHRPGMQRVRVPGSAGDRERAAAAQLPADRGDRKHDEGEGGSRHVRDYGGGVSGGNRQPGERLPRLPPSCRFRYRIIRRVIPWQARAESGSARRRRTSSALPPASESAPCR